MLKGIKYALKFILLYLIFTTDIKPKVIIHFGFKTTERLISLL